MEEETSAAEMYALLAQADPAEIAEMINIVEAISGALFDAMYEVFEAMPEDQELSEAVIILGISSFMLKTGKVLQMLSERGKDDGRHQERD